MKTFKIGFEGYFDIDKELQREKYEHVCFHNIKHFFEKLGKMPLPNEDMALLIEPHYDFNKVFYSLTINIEIEYDLSSMDLTNEHIQKYFQKMQEIRDDLIKWKESNNQLELGDEFSQNYNIFAHKMIDLIVENEPVLITN